MKAKSALLMYELVGAVPGSGSRNCEVAGELDLTAEDYLLRVSVKRALERGLLAQTYQHKKYSTLFLTREGEAFLEQGWNGFVDAVTLGTYQPRRLLKAAT